MLQSCLFLYIILIILMVYSEPVLIDTSSSKLDQTFLGGYLRYICIRTEALAMQILQA